MTYFTSLRQDFIDWRLAAHGEVQRADLMRIFGVSLPQASVDINEFLAARPAAIQYDKTRRRYVPPRKHPPSIRLTKIAEALEWD